MGRVFSLEDIRNERIPGESDFRDSVDGFSSAVEAELRWGAIDGAIIYGSVAIGRQSHRSDLDCMIIPNSYSTASRLAIERILASADPSGKVQVTPITYPSSILASGNHEIDRFFKHHLTGEGRLIYGNDPANYMRSADQKPEDILRYYIRHEKESIGSVAYAKDSEKYRKLSRVLELPLAIGRKALMAYDELNNTTNSDFNTAEKDRLERRAMALFASLGLNDVPQSILDLDKGYTESLGQTVSGQMSENEYSQIIEEIRIISTSASQWLDDFETAFAEQHMLL